MVKISAAFLERSIDNLCYATYMYKVELSGVDNKNFNVPRALHGLIALENIIDGA